MSLLIQKRRKNAGDQVAIGSCFASDYVERMVGVFQTNHRTLKDKTYVSLDTFDT